MKAPQTVTVPLDLWENIKSGLKKMQLPGPAGQVQQFLNELDAVQPNSAPEGDKA